MKIIFMGTPDFAVKTLEHLIDAGHEITCVVTQPDKPRGRGKIMQFPPVKECAVKYDIPVFQPIKIKEPESLIQLKKYDADLIVVVAFGQILPKEVLEYPKFGCINVHASLLPKYRGAAPIQWAVIDGEKTSGVTIMKMDEGLDTGDMISKVEIALKEEETGGSLFDKLAEKGAKLCVETVSAIEQGTATYVPQDNEKSTYAKILKKEIGNIDWNQSAVSIERLIRGLNPWPSAYSFLHGKTCKIWKGKVVEQQHTVEPGQVAFVDKNELWVQTKDGCLSLEEIQLEGKKRMNICDFLRGYKVEVGDYFTREKV